MNSVLLYISNILISILPSTRCFSLKRFLLKKSGIILGENVRVGSSVKFYGPGIIEIGDNVWIGHGTQIISSSKILIGNDVDIAPEVLITTGTHEIDRISVRSAGKGVSKDITIEDGVWLCARVVILPGVNIGKKSIVAAGSVVTKDISEGFIYGGVPARKIKEI